MEIPFLKFRFENEHEALVAMYNSSSFISINASCMSDYKATESFGPLVPLHLAL